MRAGPIVSLRLLLLLAYPPLAHLAVVSGSRRLTAAVLILLGVATLYTPLRAGRAYAWWTLGLAATVTTLLATAGGGVWLMVALSLALPGVVMTGFLMSLQHGRTPLITRIAAQVQNPLPEPMVVYTRQLTLLWAVVIAALMSVELALILFGSALDWSRYANGYAYLTIAAVFVIEYGYRRLRFRHLPQPDLRTYLRALLSQHHLQPGQRI